MRTNAPLMIVLVTPRSSRAGDSGADFTIRSIFSAKFLAAAAAEEELPAASSKHFSGAWGARGKIENVARICVTTCKSLWKKRPLGRKKKSKFKNWTPAKNATAAAPSRVRVASIVRFVVVAVR